jgi:hypothetical protein
MRHCCVLLLTLVAACGGSKSVNAPEPSPEARELRKLAAEILARPEIDVDEVSVQHCLIGVRSDGGLGNRPRLSQFEAEQKAAVLLKQARNGADFRLLVLENTYDHISDTDNPGVYGLVRSNLPRSERAPVDSATGRYYRDDMVTAFWKVAWRLKVGEIGVTEKSEADSPFGYHIIKRLK